MNDVANDYGVDFTPNDTKGAALSVAVMIVGAAIFLALLKRSGFRAMVAVGRGG
ncbi:MAG TPA: hypothetical protein VKG92_07270 [Flavobacteriales bacterium]|nr:hypothetical protein [Flavobacteriales bacterium]